jgi:hypothetical protein
MARISTYQVDTNVTGADIWIGTDGNDNKKTKNFSPNILAQYLNENEVISTANSLRYRYDTIASGDIRKTGTISFQTEIGANVAFSSITTFILSNKTLGSNTVDAFLNILPNTRILIQNSSNINFFGIYFVDSITPHLTETGYYVVNLTYVSGNGNLSEDKDYLIHLIEYKTVVAPTPTLQSVTDEGDTTTTTVHLDGGALSNSINEQAIFQPDLISTVNLNSGSGASIDSTGKVALSPDGLVSTLFASDNITQDITLQAPNKTAGSYTLATTDDIPAAQVNSDWDATSGVAEILNKPTIPAAVTKTSDLINDGENGVDPFITAADIPPVTGFVPYTGATDDVNLGTHDLTATQGTFATSGNPDTLTVNHSSGSGKALTITKGGAGEGIYVNKTSGSGNAVTIVGDLEATTLKKTGGTSSQFLKADGSVDSNTYFELPALTSGSVLFSNGSTIAQDNAQLFWNDTNNRLGIGTAAPISELSVASVSGITLQSGAIMPNLHRDNTDGAFLIRSYSTGTSTYTTNVKVRPNGNFLIGTTTDAGFRLDVNGTARVSGELTVNGVNIGLGGGAITTNTRVGLNAGLNNTTGGNNSSFGYSAGRSNTTGGNNSFFGRNAGLNNTTGSSNSFVGYNAGRSNTTGDSNSFFGLDAGYSNTTGGSNSFFGD